MCRTSTKQSDSDLEGLSKTRKKNRMICGVVEMERGEQKGREKVKEREIHWYLKSLQVNNSYPVSFLTRTVTHITPDMLCFQMIANNYLSIFGELESTPKC